MCDGDNDGKDEGDGHDDNFYNEDNGAEGDADDDGVTTMTTAMKMMMVVLNEEDRRQEQGDDDKVMAIKAIVTIMPMTMPRATMSTSILMWTSTLVLTSTIDFFFEGPPRVSNSKRAAVRLPYPNGLQGSRHWFSLK